jgi:hypothetical protein
MAKRKQPNLTHGQRKRMRTRQVVLTVFAILLLASMLLGLATTL